MIFLLIQAVQMVAAFRKIKWNQWMDTFERKETNEWEAKKNTFIINYYVH